MREYISISLGKSFVISRCARGDRNAVLNVGGSVCLCFDRGREAGFFSFVGVVCSGVVVGHVRSGEATA